MATGEELVYDVSFKVERIDVTSLIDDKAIPRLVELNDQIEKYQRELKALDDIKKSGKELTESQIRQIQETKLALKDTQAEYRGIQKSIQSVDNAVKSSTNTYNGLVKQNAALSAAMRDIPFTDTTGKLQRMQAEYNANNDVLKQFDKAMGNNQRNVGNYESALGGLESTLSGIPGPIGDIIRTFQTLEKTLSAVSGSFSTKTTVIQGFTASTAVATSATAAHTTAETAQATAVTASAGAIGFDTTATTANTVATTGNTAAASANATAQGAQAVASTASATAIGATTVAQRALNLVMKANPVLLVVSAVAALIAAFSSLQPMMDQIRLAATAISTAFQYVRDTVYNFLTGEEQVRESMGKTIQLAVQYEKQLIALEQRRIGMIEQTAINEKLVAERRLKAKDETLSYAERIKELTEAVNLENSEMIEQIRLIEEIVANKELLLGLTRNQRTDDEELANLRAKLYITEKNTFTRQRKLQSEITSLKNQEQSEEKARIAEQERINKKASDELKRQLQQRKLALDAYRNAILSMNDTMEMALMKQNELLTNNPLETPELELDTNRTEQVLAGAYDLGEQLAQQSVQQAQMLGDQMAVLELQQLEDLRQRKLYYLGLNYTDAEAAQMAMTDLAVSHAQERANKEVDIERMKADQKTQIISGFANVITALGTALFGKSKAISIAEAIVNTYVGATSALRANYGVGPLAVAAKFAAAAAVIANGLKSVATIARTNIGGGVPQGAGATAGASMATSTRVMSGFAVAEGTQSFATMNERAASVGAQASDRRQSGVNITIDAKVDRKGLALAVRDGETEIRTEQFTYI